MGIGRARLSDLEIFMREAGLGEVDRSACRQMVSLIDGTYCGEVNALIQSKAKKSA